jgi:hypothetical protein
VWPVRPEGLTNPNDVTSSKEVFAASYVVGNTWVSGPSGGHILVPFDTQGLGQLTLDIGVAVASFDMPADHSAGANGTISGVLDTEAFVTEFARVVGAFDISLCSGPTIESIKNQIRQASDIMKDGSPGTAAETCDGISIGLGFDAALVQLGGVGPATTPSNPCGP